MDDHVSSSLPPISVGVLSRTQLVLASASKRRRELLAQIGVRFELMPVDSIERQHAGESSRDYVQRAALEKAQAGWRASKSVYPVLGADTAIELNGRTFGKPADKTHAMAMLNALSGREHRVYSGVAVVAAERYAQRVSCTRVVFRSISSDEIQRYWASGEPLGKAGAYAIQGRAAVFVADLRGSYSGVVGLPLFETAQLLREFGVQAL